ANDPARHAQKQQGETELEEVPRRCFVVRYCWWAGRNELPLEETEEACHEPRVEHHSVTVLSTREFPLSSVRENVPLHLFKGLRNRHSRERLRNRNGLDSLTRRRPWLGVTDHPFVRNSHHATTRVGCGTGSDPGRLPRTGRGPNRQRSDSKS